MSLKYEVNILESIGWLSHNRHGSKHRKNAAASIWRHGAVEWYEYGVPHRCDGASGMDKLIITYPRRLWV